jgi:hypothetical protein
MASADIGSTQHAFPATMRLWLVELLESKIAL